MKKRKITNFVFFLSCIVVVMFTGCATHLKYDPNKDYGFVVPQKEMGLENPPPNKARIYGFRYETFVGFAVRHNVTIHTLAQANNGFREGYFFGFSRPGVAFYLDIIPNGEPLFISGRTEARKNISFTPQAGKIYCVEMSFKMGFVIGVPKFMFVEKERCGEFVSKYFNDDSMKEWLADKQKFENKWAKQTGSQNDLP